MDVVALGHYLPPITATTVRPWSRISLALLVITGQGTMLASPAGLATGGSDRTSQRFVALVLPGGRGCGWVFVTISTGLMPATDALALKGPSPKRTRRPRDWRGFSRASRANRGQGEPSGPYT